MTEHLKRNNRVENLDGTLTEYFDVPATEENLCALIRSIFEDHWGSINYGPCLQGAVFELAFKQQPKVSYLDGYFTIGAEGEQGSHFHLCVGVHAGTGAHPTPPELAAWRRCSRAAFYRDRDANSRDRSWGLRLWNGRGEQMLTVFFPNPWLNSTRTKIMKEPDWTKLALWMDLRARYAGVTPDPPPVDELPKLC